MPTTSSPLDVGNKSAVFPLQLLGFDVDVINSVQFSNHTGYEKGFQGDILKGEQLRNLLAGLEANDLLHEIGHLLTGYIGSESFLEAVLDVLKTLRQYGPVRYVCDPVLGDKGKFYVPERLVEVYRTKVVPVADILTPNQFELEQLTGIPIHSEDDAIRACAVLHEMGPELVFLTSFELESTAANHEPTIGIMASHRQKGTSSPSTSVVWRIDCPMLSGQFTGTGDLCAALLLAHSALEPDNIPGVMERVINTMFAIIELTHVEFQETARSRELKLIQSKSIIENPPERFKACEYRSK